MKARLQQCPGDADPIWSPPPTPPSAPVVVDDALPIELEAALDELILAPLAPGETAHAGHRRKEHAIGELFAGVSIPQARALHARLVRARKDDALAAAFGRLAADRRQRLLDFLGEARRRAAILRARAEGAAIVRVVVQPWSPA